MVSDGCVPSLEMPGREGSAVLTEFGSDLASLAYGYEVTSMVEFVVESSKGPGPIVSATVTVLYGIFRPAITWKSRSEQDGDDFEKDSRWAAGAQQQNMRLRSRVLEAQKRRMGASQPEAAKGPSQVCYSMS